MPRANRFLLPGQVWHITHRCHQREFLLKFGRDRQRWRYWLFEARFQSESGIATFHREIVQGDDCYRLRDPGARYNSHFDPEMACLRADNAVLLDELF